MYRIRSFDAHIALLHDFDRHVMDVIKCHEMANGILRHLLYDVNAVKYGNMGINRTVLIRHFDI